MRAFTPLKKILTWTNMSIMVITLSIGNVQAKETPVKPKVDNQLLCLAKNIYYEAGLESRDGMVAVAQVTLNRTEDNKFPKTVCGVVNQKTQVTTVRENKPVVKTICQFSWVCRPPAPVKYVSDRWAESLMVASEVLYQGLRLPSDAMAEALYFHNTSVRPNWGLEQVARIGNHIFYSDDPAPKRQTTLDKQVSK